MLKNKFLLAEMDKSKDLKIKIKENTRLISSLKKTEVFVELSTRAKEMKYKIIQIAGNTAKDNSIACKFGIFSFKNLIKMNYSIEDSSVLPLALHMKIYVHEGQKNVLLSEDMINFNKENKHQTIYAKTNALKEKCLFYISLCNTYVELEDTATKPLGIIDEGNTSYMEGIIHTLFWLNYTRHYVYRIKPKDFFAKHLQEVFHSLQVDNKPVRLDKLLNSLTGRSDWNQPKDPIKALETVLNNIDMKSLKNLFGLASKKAGVECIQFLSADVTKTLDDFTLKFALENKKNVSFTLPKLLLIRLNRFENNKKTKDCSSFKYDSTLSFSNFSKTIPNSQTRYWLFSVIVHEGKSLSNGLFYSYLKLPNQQGDWWKLNGTLSIKVTLDEVFNQNYGGEYISYSFSDQGQIISTRQEDNKTAYLLIYINEFYNKELCFDFANQEIPTEIVSRCLRKKEKDKSELSLSFKDLDKEFGKRRERMKFYSQMRSAPSNEISFFNDINNIYINNIVNNQESFEDQLTSQPLTQKNPTNFDTFFNNTSLLTVIQPYKKENENQGGINNLNQSKTSSKLFNESFLYKNTISTQRYLKFDFSIDLINNETNRVLETLNFKDTLLDNSPTSIMFLPICFKKITSNEYYDISLFKLVLLTTHGFYIKILNDMDDIAIYIQLHYEGKVILCLYTFEIDVIMDLNQTKKLISINFNNYDISSREENQLNGIKHPVLISNSKLFSGPKSKCLKAFKQLIEKYSYNRKINHIFLIKHFGSSIREAIEKQSVETEKIDISDYDILKQMKIIRLMVK